jgi:DNA-binding GntR family transcriptional regulator
VDIDSIATKLDMSPTPVREGLRLVEAEGLVVSRPHRGTSVVYFATDDAAELYTLRAVLESLATRLSVPHLTASDYESLRRTESERAAALARGDMTAASELNEQWHMTLYSRAMATPYLSEFIGRLWNAFPWTTSLRVPGRAQNSLSDHGAIARAARDGDADAAARLMEAHILDSKGAVLELLTKAKAGRPG